tara:strand:- start:277 stop:615 length:339 start_codon:yes stop_codon:yes gene_type:complete
MAYRKDGPFEQLQPYIMAMSDNKITIRRENIAHLIQLLANTRFRNKIFATYDESRVTAIWNLIVQKSILAAELNFKKVPQSPNAISLHPPSPTLPLLTPIPSHYADQAAPGR